LSALAQRYATALADVALERNKANAIKNDLASFTETYRASTDLQNFLSSPSISAAVKKSFLAKLAEQMHLQEEVRNFLFLLVDHGRTELLPGFMPVLESELNARLGIAEAQVTSARELGEDEKRELVTRLERITGKKIETRYTLDPGVLGGAVVQIGSTIYDGSVREQLERLRTQLEAELA
jgi:F-type H+-transporting ATPase subunit delta